MAAPHRAPHGRPTERRPVPRPGTGGSTGTPHPYGRSIHAITVAVANGRPGSPSPPVLTGTTVAGDRERVK
ncbi:hypothetical protein [Actinoallomurus vinaceus]